MTDFHQRQVLSTLTAPAARGLTPHSLVQPVNPNGLPGHGNSFQFSVILYAKDLKKANTSFGYTRKYWKIVCNADEFAIYLPLLRGIAPQDMLEKRRKLVYNKLLLWVFIGFLRLNSRFLN